jgi:hypothetical protein
MLWLERLKEWLTRTRPDTFSGAGIDRLILLRLTTYLPLVIQAQSILVIYSMALESNFLLKSLNLINNPLTLNPILLFLLAFLNQNKPSIAPGTKG